MSLLISLMFVVMLCMEMDQRAYFLHLHMIRKHNSCSCKVCRRAATGENTPKDQHQQRSCRHGSQYGLLILMIVGMVQRSHLLKYLYMIKKIDLKLCNNKGPATTPNDWLSIYVQEQQNKQ